MTAQLITIRNNIVARLAALFPNAMRAANPYELDSEPSSVLANGYAVTVGTGNDPNKLHCNAIIPTRLIAVTLTREVPSEMDADKRTEIEDQIFEDDLTIIKDFYANSGTLGDAKKVGDNGIEYLQTLDAAGKYFVFLMTFEISYQENL